MIIRPGISAIWNEPFPDLAASLDAVLSHAPQNLRIFFRADDIAVPSTLFTAMINTFMARQTILELAVTPAWLRQDHARKLLQECADEHLFRFHQHGWRHVNHQQSGKKGEFGTDRTGEAKKNDIAKGSTKLRTLLGPRFEKRFTPPWNRFDGETGTILQDLGFKTASRSNGEQRKVPLPAALPDIFVNVDLHTRTEPTPREGRAALLDELKEAITSGHCGIMLHHQRMNRHAVTFLDELLTAAKRAGHTPSGFRELSISS